MILQFPPPHHSLIYVPETACPNTYIVYTFGSHKNVYHKLINVFMLNQRIVTAYILVIYFCDQKLFTANQKTHPSHFRRACQNWKLTIIFMIQSDEHDLQYYYGYSVVKEKKYMDHHIKTFYGKLSHLHTQMSISFPLLQSRGG